MLRFTGTELHAVLAEAGINGCRLILVKDHGVYLMSEIGESKPDGGGRKRVAYATGCNPSVDDFDTWWNRPAKNSAAMILPSTSTSMILSSPAFAALQDRWW
jgi:Protein of unknown function (DUF3085)